jgi:hypothetical protein
LGSRTQNERRFTHWQNLPGGGRLYSSDVRGRSGWSARYLKEVDANENTVRFWQEIRDDHGRLVEVHEKYPVDRGHRKT